jgi:hypothetical protein
MKGFWDLGEEDEFESLSRSGSEAMMDTPFVRHDRGGGVLLSLHGTLGFELRASAVKLPAFSLGEGADIHASRPSSFQSSRLRGSEPGASELMDNWRA